jgi:hypothetical protein
MARRRIMMMMKMIREVMRGREMEVRCKQQRGQATRDCPLSAVG